MPLKFSGAFAAILLLALASPLSGLQENNAVAVVTIRVEDTTGQPITNAQVRIVARPAMAEIVLRSTSATGTVPVELKPGAYNLTITADGYTSSTVVDLEIKPREQREIDATLKILDCGTPGWCGNVDPEPLPYEQERAKLRDNEIHTPFRLKRISDGHVCPFEHLDCKDRGVWWKDFTILTSDDHQLDLLSIPFPNRKRPKKLFDKHLKAADSILRREADSDTNGNVVGERALAAFLSGSGPDNHYYDVFWIRDKAYFSVTGKNLEDVLALERKLKEEGTNAVWSWH